MKYYQQGNVLLKKVDSLPKDAINLKTKILQLGEVTGHKHQFGVDDDVHVFVDKAFAGQELSITPDEGKFVIIGSTAYLRHEEHKPIGIEPGIYQIDIVREYDYDKDEIRRVVD